MSPDGVTTWIALVETIRNLGPFGVTVGIIYVLYRGLYISKRESDERVAAAVVQSTSEKLACDERIRILERELEKREGLYISSLGEFRIQVKRMEERERELHDEKWKVLNQLAESNREMYRISEVIADLREAVDRLREAR
jgi:hypothetical protein